MVVTVARIITGVADKIVARLAPKAKASACIPNDPYYTCWNHAYMYCTNNCTGTEFCHQVGSC